MIVITRDDDGSREAPLLPKDGKARHPARRRPSPAFDLGIVFNNLRPVLRRSNADDVNTRVARARPGLRRTRGARAADGVRPRRCRRSRSAPRGPVVTELVDQPRRRREDGRRARRRAPFGDRLARHDRGDARRRGRRARACRGQPRRRVGRARPRSSRTTVRGSTGRSRSSPTILAIVADAQGAISTPRSRRCRRRSHALNRATTYGAWVNLNAVCINDICGAGFTSTSGRGATARQSLAAHPAREGRAMKPFRERNPIVVGLISVAVLVVLMLFAFSLNRFTFFRGVYVVEADFADAAGLTPENEVRVAGLKVGQGDVDRARPSPTRRRRRPRARRDGGRHAASSSAIATEAEIKLKTILGAKFVDIVPKGGAPFVGRGRRHPARAHADPVRALRGDEPHRRDRSASSTRRR